MTNRNTRSRVKIYLFTTLSLLVSLSLLDQAHSAIIVSDPVKVNDGWSLTGNPFEFLTAQSGISPTAGSSFMHIQNAGGREGTKAFTGLAIAPGTYVVTFDIGNFNNRPFAVINDFLTGVTAGGVVLTPVSSASPTPPDGGILAWTRTYNIGDSDPSVGATLGFRVSAPNTGLDQNASFDNLLISYSVPEPSTLALLSLGASWMIFRRRRIFSVK